MYMDFSFLQISHHSKSMNVTTLIHKLPKMRRLGNLFVTRGLMILAIHQISTMAEPMRGHNMEPAKIRFVASIGMKVGDAARSRKHHATGSLIAENLVLTAAHSVEGFRFDMMDVVFGHADLRGAKPRYDVDSWITFEQWAKMNDRSLIGDETNDLAIIKLKGRVSGVTPANITTLGIENFFGKNVTLVGWAAAKNGQPRFMKKAKVRILTNTECEQREQLQSNTIQSNAGGKMCTVADPFTVLTLGDSGGPLLDENRVIIAVNRGLCIDKLDCSEEFVEGREYNVHTYFLDKYRRFIDEMKAHWLLYQDMTNQLFGY